METVLPPGDGGALSTPRINIKLHRWIAFFCLLPITAAAQPGSSVCYGTTGAGRLDNGVRLPHRGNNFISYGRLPELLGRTYVHDLVRATVLDAYRNLGVSLPEKRFKFGETGLKTGGAFKPHKTHQNGLSVDFMVPVIDNHGNSTYFPTTVLNRYGYDVEFDSAGRYRRYRIDFDALGAHIVALHKAARKNGIGIGRVLFAPDLQASLYATKYGAYIKRNIRIPAKKSWVRHDEHYHVDFQVRCESLR